MTLDELFTPHTPYETYGGIDVKREDLYCHPSIAPLAKMRGVNKVMLKLKEQGINTVGVFDFKVSRAGVGISAMAKMLDMHCYACYQHYKAYDKDGLPQQQLKCLAWGATLHPIRAAQIQINYNMAKGFVKAQGGYMFPKGIILEETLDSVIEEVTYDRERLSRYKNIVLSNGSGTIVSGLLRGLNINGLSPTIYTISCTTETKHCKRLHQFLKEEKYNGTVYIVPSDIEYYTECTIDCPFPSHPNYDRKAWAWLMKNPLDDCLFWNIGA